MWTDENHKIHGDLANEIANLFIECTEPDSDVLFGLIECVKRSGLEKQLEVKENSVFKRVWHVLKENAVLPFKISAECNACTFKFSPNSSHLFIPEICFKTSEHEARNDELVKANYDHLIDKATEQLNEKLHTLEEQERKTGEENKYLIERLVEFSNKAALFHLSLETLKKENEALKAERKVPLEEQPSGITKLVRSLTFTEQQSKERNTNAEEIIGRVEKENELLRSENASQKEIIAAQAQKIAELEKALAQQVQAEH